MMPMQQHYCLRFHLPEKRLSQSDAACPVGSSCATGVFSASCTQQVSVSATSSFKLGAFRSSNAPLSHGSHGFPVGPEYSSSSLREEGGGDEEEPCRANRRLILMMTSRVLAAGIASNTGLALAVKQILLAGRVPGLSAPDENGYRTYRRPDAKSGGHGVGWSPIIPYSFKVTDEWEEVPVSIADLGGTEIDLRFSNKQEGNISVVVAPVLRFASDFGDNVKIEQIGPPEKVIDAFGPELVGQNVEGQVQDMEVSEHDGRKYYLYELKSPHVLITATAAGNRLYLMTVGGNARQWKKFREGLKQIAESFRVG